MPGSSYRLCGFTSGVDCRAVQFKDPLPPARICGLCGFVPDKIAVLPCSHLLCESCLQGCADGDVCGCPMDETTFQVDADISWITPPRHHLSKLQVSCWNADNGCTFEGTAGELLGHFEGDCSYHAAMCPRCLDRVLRKDLPRHYKTGCAAIASTAACLGTSMENHRSSAGKVASSYDDILASIQGRTNELVESVNLMTRRLLDNEEPLETISVERQLRALAHTLRTFLERTQEARTSTQVAAGVGENFSAGAFSEVIPGPAEEQVLLCLEVRWHVHNRDTFFGACFSISIDGKPTNVEIQCLTSSVAKSLTVFAKDAEPGKWGLPDIEPLPTGEFHSPFLVSWAHENVNRAVSNEIKPGFIPRCICRLPDEVEEKYGWAKTILHFLIKMKRSA
ncbi:uncharacterized protein LOC144158955 [Haemaphysalis longicornis]